MNGTTDTDWGDISVKLGLTSGDQFDEVISAFASYNRRPQPLTYEQVKAAQRAARRNNPLHQKALERRRKRKRGGPK